MHLNIQQSSAAADRIFEMLDEPILVKEKPDARVFQEPLQAVVSTVRATLEKTPPELAADIIDRGMVLTGGSAQLRNIAQLLTQETGVPAYVAENPIACVALGAGRALENYEIMRRSLPIVPD